MKKILRKIFINNYKNIFFMILNSQSKYFSLENIELKIKKDCKLGRKNTIIRTQIDEIITPNILKNGKWDYFVVNFIKKKTKNTKVKFNFIDIGANIGLISKQLINEKIKIDKYHCVEPEKKNFEILKKNLKFSNKALFYNIALTNKKSSYQKIYLSNNNFGDYSLLKKKNSNFSLVKCENINSFFNNISKIIKNNKIIYKSDTQGFDEMLILSLEKKYLKKISILIIEVSNFNFLEKNKKKFLNLTKYFNIIEDEKGNKLNKMDLSNKINQKKELNLLFAKN